MYLNAGDTANKIGTYSLAVLAIHHHIPFYVAAPLTSIDLALSSGQEIVIEERSAKELLHSRGGLGEQVAASGISVWNPAFDVTPAYMISGIITEKVGPLSLSLKQTQYTHKGKMKMRSYRNVIGSIFVFHSLICWFWFQKLLFTYSSL